MSSSLNNSQQAERPKILLQVLAVGTKSIWQLHATDK